MGSCTNSRRKKKDSETLLDQILTHALRFHCETTQIKCHKIELKTESNRGIHREIKLVKCSVMSDKENHEFCSVEYS